MFGTPYRTKLGSAGIFRIVCGLAAFGAWPKKAAFQETTKLRTVKATELVAAAAALNASIEGIVAVSGDSFRQSMLIDDILTILRYRP